MLVVLIVESQHQVLSSISKWGNFVEYCEAVPYCFIHNGSRVVACFETTSHALLLRNFIVGLGVVNSIARRMKIYCDNSTTVFFSKNGKYYRLYWFQAQGNKDLVVRERIQKQQVSIEKIK